MKDNTTSLPEKLLFRCAITHKKIYLLVCSYVWWLRGLQRHDTGVHEELNKACLSLLLDSPATLWRTVFRADRSQQPSAILILEKPTSAVGAAGVSDERTQWERSCSPSQRRHSKNGARVEGHFDLRFV